MADPLPLLLLTPPLAKAVKHPGARGGRGFYTRKGTWRYGANAITHDEVRALAAQGRAKWGDDANVDKMEVLTHPHVYKVWQRLNPGWKIERSSHPKWGEGYNVYQEHPGIKDESGKLYRSYWNSPKDDYYAHHPSNAWNGVWRNTRHQFIQDLVNDAAGYPAPDDSEATRYAQRKGKLRVVRSTALPEDIAVGDRIRRISGDVVHVLGAEDEDLIVGDDAGNRSNLSVAAVRAGRAELLKSVLSFLKAKKPEKKKAAALEPAPPPSREDQGKHVLGHTTSKKPVYASGADGAGFSDDEHQEAARLHAKAHLHHTQTAEKLRAGADADDDWQRSEGQHQRAAAHDTLAQHHFDLVRDHLVAGGHGGEQEMGWDEKRSQPKLGKVVPHGAKQRAEAKERLKKRVHAEHPGGTSDVDRNAYAPKEKTHAS